MDSSKRVIESINTNKPLNVKETQSKTIRLTIDLSKTDKDGCAVFNYQELVKAEKKKLNILNKSKQLQNGASDPFNNEDEEALKKIASQYEEKYGSASSMRYQTYTELGAGYDESDSFIDNTEACEEAMPEDVEPKRGGFYVNCGKLEYKRLQHRYLHPKNKRKWMMDSESGEEECSSEEKRNTTDECPEKERLEKSDDSDCRTWNGKKSNNKMKKMSKIKISDEVSKDRSSKHSSYSELGGEQVSKTNLGGSSSEAKELLLNNESSQCLDVNCTDERKETYTSQPVGSETCSVTHRTNNENSDMVGIVYDSDSSNSSDKDLYQKDEPPKLPELSDIIAMVNDLKNLARRYKSTHKKFFNEETNSLLYRLESTCRKKLNSSGRHAVYSHLAHYLPFTKSTLVSRMKKIFVGSGELESYIIRIKDLVASSNKIKEVYDLEQLGLQEIKPFLEQLVQLKIRQFIVMTTKKKVPLESYIVDFLTNVATIWPNGVVKVGHLHNLVFDTIKMQAEAFNITYSPDIPFGLDPRRPHLALCDINSQSQKTEQDGEIREQTTEPIGNTTEDGTISKEIIKLKDETMLSPLNVGNKDQDLTVTKLSQKKHKNGSGKWSQQIGKKIDDRGLDRETESREKYVSKFSSNDEKVLMQLDQVMQDLVVLNQMSSDTTSNTKVNIL